MAGKRKYATEEERLEAIKASKRKYNTSARGRAVMKNWYAEHKDDPLFKERRNAKQEIYRAELPENTKALCSRRASAQQRQRRIDSPAYPMFNDAKKRAKQKNLEFSITLEDIQIPEYCPVLGIKLFVVGGKRTDNSPSLDRVDNLRGYEKDNIRVISSRANSLKNNGSIEEFRKIIEYMEEHFRGLVRD